MGKWERTHDNTTQGANMTPLTDKTPVAEIRKAWGAEVRATRREALDLCETGFTPRITQIEVLAVGPRGRVDGGELDYIETASDITAESLAKWAAEARRLGATRLSFDGRWDLVNRTDEDDYDLSDIYVEVDLRLD